MKLHTQSFVPVGDDVVTAGAGGGAGTYAAGSVSVPSGADGVMFQCTDSYAYVSITQAVTDNTKGLFVAENDHPQILWIDRVQVPTIYFALHDDVKLRYMFVKRANLRG